MAHHERAGQDVEMSLDRGVGFAERPGQFGRVPRLPVIVRQHRPQPAQGLRGHFDSEPADVAFEERLHEVLTPAPARVVSGGENRSGEAAPQPQPADRREADFAQTEAAHGHERDPSRQRLRAVANQVRRGAAEQQEARSRRPAVRQHAQEREQ